ncbi:MAG: 2-oxoacid:ferredoxin oxidoreductase subunit beta [Gammaproteobacteria bacterium]|nr:2-oxoacid:ferredoxin oxidoreductase subunit beta [Gammaproteobacteria bacterium]
MSFIKKPQPLRTHLPINNLGLTLRDYEGGMSTLCAGCGHDSISAAMAMAFFELSLPPHRAIKVSGIGCSSKTPAYFLRASHGMNAVHGRMPAIATGAGAANRELALIGVSGDGDSLSIGLGQFAHAMRRNLNMLYVLENNGVYGLTKGQFSASAEVGTKAKKGQVNRQQPIDPVLTALGAGCTFVARSFSGDKEQLVPLIKAGLEHRGFAMIDVISPCVTFNDHEGSMKSYAYTREASQELVHADYVPHAQPIEVSLADTGVTPVTLHDGSHILLRKTDEDYDPGDRAGAFAKVLTCQEQGEIVTGLLYIDAEAPQMHEVNGTVGRALVDVDYSELCPGADALQALQARMR